MEFEDILVYVGDYGKYQRNLMLIFLFPSAALLPWFSMNILFLVAVPDHWCYVPEVASSNLTLLEQRTLITPPEKPEKPGCSMYDVNYTEILNLGNWSIPENTETKSCTEGYVYDKTNYEATATSKWDLVCDDSEYVSHVLTLANVGSIIGTPIYGMLADKYGRKPIFFLTVLVTAITAISSVLMTNFTAFLILRTINGSLMPSIFQLPYIILLELVGPDMRTRMNGIANNSWTFGLCFLPLLAWLTRDWVTLGLVTSSVTVLFFIYWTILPESPRWLVSQGKYSEAVDVMMKIAKSNGKQQEPSEILMQFKKLGEKIKKEEKLKKGEKNTSMDIFKYPKLRQRFFIITLCWVADIMAYYGIQYNVPNLGGNEFLNFFLLAIAEVPGFVFSWVFMETLGRRWCSVTSLILTGIACLVPVVLPEDLPYVAVISSFVGKFGASASFMAVYQQSAELYPTTMRSLGMGLSSTVAALAAIAVPYVVYLAEYGKFIPFLIIAFFCVAAGLSACFLPETLNENLPQTILDAESFGITQKFFSCNRRRRPSCHEHLPYKIQDPNIEMNSHVK